MFRLIRGCRSINLTLTPQKLRMLQIQGVKGEAVVHYCESLTTKEMRHHRLSRRVNNRTKLFISPAVACRDLHGSPSKSTGTRYHVLFRLIVLLFMQR